MRPAPVSGRVGGPWWAALAVALLLVLPWTALALGGVSARYRATAAVVGAGATPASAGQWGPSSASFLSLHTVGQVAALGGAAGGFITADEGYLYRLRFVGAIAKATAADDGHESAPSLELRRNVSHDFKMVVRGGTPVTVTGYMKVNAGYLESGAALPSWRITGPGVDETVTMTRSYPGDDGAQAGHWEQITATVQPEQGGVLTLRVATHAYPFDALAHLDDLAVAQDGGVPPPSANLAVTGVGVHSFKIAADRDVIVAFRYRTEGTAVVEATLTGASGPPVVTGPEDGWVKQELTTEGITGPTVLTLEITVSGAGEDDETLLDDFEVRAAP